MHDAPDTPEQDERDRPANTAPGERAPQLHGVELLTYADAAARLGMTPDAVRMRCRRGRLACEDTDRGRLVVWPQPGRDGAAPVRLAVSDPNGERTDRPEPAVRSAERLAAELRRAEHDRDAARIEAARWQALHAAESERVGQALRIVEQAQAAVAAERGRADALAVEVAALRALPTAVPFAERTDRERQANRSPNAPPAAASPRPWWRRLLWFLP